MLSFTQDPSICRNFVDTRIDDAMTEVESLELQRLEVNARRLVGIVSAQSESLRKLREELALRDQELARLRAELSQARQQERAATLASALSGLPAQADSSDVRSLLDEIINDVDRCIRQLSAEEA